MEGMLYRDRKEKLNDEYGRVEHYQSWCAEIMGRMMHIHSKLTTSCTGYLIFQLDVDVELCDKSCREELQTIDPETSAKAVEKTSQLIRNLSDSLRVR